MESEILHNDDAMGLLYGKWQIAEDTWCITNRWQNFMYLLIGDDSAMLIDTGCGEGNLREVVESITDKPVMVVNTHGHFDHTGGNSCWPKAYMTKEAAVHAKMPFSPMHKQWFEAKKYPDYEVIEIADGDILELGNRKIEVIGIPAHSEGSVALLDPKTRSLFTGDEIESGQVIWFVRNEPITLAEMAAMHKENMKKLLMRQNEYDRLWPAHNGAPLLPEPYLNDFIELDNQIMENKAQKMKTTAGFGFPKDNQSIDNPFRNYGILNRLEYGVASVVYSESISVYHNE